MDGNDNVVEAETTLGGGVGVTSMVLAEDGGDTRVL
jgi:hypothetical protein